MAKKIKVKLRDKGSIFHDTSQGVSVTGSKPVEIRLTKRVREALKHGVIIKAGKVKPEPTTEDESNSSPLSTTEDESNSSPLSTTEDESDGSQVPNYGSFTKKELKAALDDKGIAYTDTDTNAELIELLQ